MLVRLKQEGLSFWQFLQSISGRLTSIRLAEVDEALLMVAKPARRAHPLVL
jgi:hypothetical protein